MIDFAEIQGPRSSKEANFAQLVGEILVRERKALTVDGAGGDEGIDSYAIDEAGSLTIFQAKYFRGRINSSRRSQIRRSFDTAQRHPKPLRWILCTPVDPTPTESRWLQSLAVDKDTAVEWWGETYLRSLISRHDDLVVSFFPEQRILAELRIIREELGGYHAIASTNASFQRHKGSVEDLYLREVAEISRLLQEDKPLAEKPDSGLVVIDFSELYQYMITAPTLVLARPIVDYCIETSPVPLALPPGGALHLHRVTKAITSDRSPWRAVTNLGQELLVALRDTFVSSYESDPEGRAAARAYKQLMHALAPSERMTYSGLQRLTKLFSSGRLRSWSRPAPRRDNLLTEIYLRLENIRPMRSLSNFASSVDMRAIMEAQESQEGGVRMLTSAVYFRHIAADIFADSSPIRSSRQYGQFLHLAKLSRAGADYSEKVIALQNVIVEMQRVLPQLDALLSGRSLPTHGVMHVLSQFADTYRALLRPVDHMVESGFQAMKRSALGSMAELYRALSTQAELTAAFHEWWEQLCLVAAELQQYLADNYDPDELASLSESVAGKMLTEII